jgi:hypothetical protein
VLVSTAYNAVTSASVLFTGASVVTSSNSAAGNIMLSQRLNSTGTVPRTTTPAMLHKQLSVHEDRIHCIQKEASTILRTQQDQINTHSRLISSQERLYENAQEVHAV